MTIISRIIHSLVNGNLLREAWETPISTDGVWDRIPKKKRAGQKRIFKAAKKMMAQLQASIEALS